MTHRQRRRQAARTRRARGQVAKSSIILMSLGGLAAIATILVLSFPLAIFVLFSSKGMSGILFLCGAAGVLAAIGVTVGREITQSLRDSPRPTSVLRQRRREPAPQSLARLATDPIYGARWNNTW